ncbi:BTB/POZ domain-containing protein [Ditylenchus destructor]|uniref:BTB/POZ domain-containing protein n=1 Tax=Ditylenchus destructor TaxID=166010 RepID=A0AAD4NCR6_9BILA|nr:BTB/POZ domain-containing protein [Ditylenchus destructor]
MSQKEDDMHESNASVNRQPKSLLSYLHNITSEDETRKNAANHKSIMRKPIAVGATSEVIERVLPTKRKPSFETSNVLSSSKESFREPKLKKVLQCGNAVTPSKSMRDGAFTRTKATKKMTSIVEEKFEDVESAPVNENAVQTNSPKFTENQKILCKRDGNDSFCESTIVGVSYNQKHQPIYAIHYEGYDTDENELISHDDAAKRFKPTMPKTQSETNKEESKCENVDEVSNKENTVASLSSPVVNIFPREAPTFKERLYPFVCPEKSIIDKFTSPGNASDCVLHLSGDRLHINKGLLSVYSHVFNAVFNQEKNQSNFKLNNVGIGEFVQLLDTIYPSMHRGVVKEENIDSLLKLGYQFGIDDILQRCERFLLDCRTISNGKKLLVAQEYSLSALMDKCASQFKSISDYKALKAENAYESLNADTKVLLGSYIADAEQEKKPAKTFIQKTK